MRSVSIDCAIIPPSLASAEFFYQHTTHTYLWWRELRHHTLQELGRARASGGINTWNRTVFRRRAQRFTFSERKFIFTPVYQSDCGSNLSWPPLTSVCIPVTSNWRRRGNSLYFMNVTLQKGEVPEKRQNWSHSARDWPELKHTNLSDIRLHWVSFTDCLPAK